MRPSWFLQLWIGRGRSRRNFTVLAAVARNSGKEWRRAMATTCSEGGQTMTISASLNGIGTHHDRGTNRKVEPTNNRAERALRFIVIARDTGQHAKNDREQSLMPRSTV